MKRIKLLDWFGGPLLAVAILLGGVAPVQATGEIGVTIDKTNVQEYKDVLIPALYRAVERGDFILPTAKLSFEYKHDPRFLAAGEKNAGKFDVNAEGDLIDKSTGKVPLYNIYGFPFPNIDKNDHHAAVKIIWNFNFMRYRFMSFHGPRTRTSWVSQDGQHYSIVSDERNLYYQGRPPGQEIKNPNNFLVNELIVSIEPMSMRGTNTLAWDYADDRNLTFFAYIPAFRRVRQASGAARSDPWHGCDGWLDVASGWSGKNRTMVWSMLGEKTILVPLTSIKKDTAVQKPDGSVVFTRPDVKFGFNTPGWKGAKWAPTTVTWVPRKVWVIGQMPKDRYYAWGMHINYVDKENYIIWMKEVNDRADQFRIWAMYPQHYSEAPNGNNSIGEYETATQIDESARHGTVTERSKEHEVFISDKNFGPNYFTTSNFLHLSR